MLGDGTIWISSDFDARPTNTDVLRNGDKLRTLDDNREYRYNAGLGQWALRLAPVATWGDRVTPANVGANRFLDQQSVMVVATIGNLEDVRFEWIGSAWSASVIYDMLQAFPEGDGGVTRHIGYPLHTGAPLLGSGTAVTGLRDAGPGRLDLPRTAGSSSVARDGGMPHLERPLTGSNYQVTGLSIGSESSFTAYYLVARYRDTTEDRAEVLRLFPQGSTSGPRIQSEFGQSGGSAPFDEKAPRCFFRRIPDDSGVTVELPPLGPDVWDAVVAAADWSAGSAEVLGTTGTSSADLEASGVTATTTTQELRAFNSVPSAVDYRALGFIDFDSVPAGGAELIAALLRPIRDFGA